MAVDGWPTESAKLLFALERLAASLRHCKSKGAIAGK